MLNKMHFVLLLWCGKSPDMPFLSDEISKLTAKCCFLSFTDTGKLFLFVVAKMAGHSVLKTFRMYAYFDAWAKKKVVRFPS